MIPFSAPISVALTACLAILRSNGLITKKSTNIPTFLKAINDAEITDEEINDIVQEVENCECMKLSIQNEHKFKGLYKNK